MTDDTEFTNADSPGTEGPTSDELADLDFGEDGGDRRRGGRRGPGRGRGRGGHLHVHVHMHGDEHRHGGRRGRGSWRGLSDSERIDRLEGFQRDLEERAADVAAKIERLRARVAEQSASSSDTTPAS